MVAFIHDPIQSCLLESDSVTVWCAITQQPIENDHQIYSLCGLLKVALPPWWLIVYTCKVPVVVERFKKIRVVFFKVYDWINDCIYNLNLIFYRSNKCLGCSSFFL